MRAPAINVDGAAAIGCESLFGRIRLTVPAERWTCILGASGVGKSSLLRLLGGLNDGITFDGAIECDDGEPLAQRSILMQQADLLLPWVNAGDNVVIGAKLRGEPPNIALAKALLTQVGLADLEHRLPSELSGGQRQRVALARTLAEDRPVVLLDEPFSALDPRTRRQMQDLALRLLSGRTVILVTHDPVEAARTADLIVIMTGDGVERTDCRLESGQRGDEVVRECAAALIRRMNTDA